MEYSTDQAERRALGWFLVSAVVSIFSLVGCKQTSASYLFETQPQTPLAAVGLNSTRSPQIAVSSAGMISLLALYQDGATTRVGFTMSHDGGDHFMPVKPVSGEGATISAHGENNPMMAVSSRTVYALWEQTQPDGVKDLVVARSLNAGQTFEVPVRVNDNKTPSFHGFASIAAGTNGDVYIAWLDGRDAPESPGTFDIYLARSTDRGATFGPNMRVARSGCPCCRPYVALGKAGEVFVAWRKVFPGSIRDLVVSASNDGGQTFYRSTRVAEDGWRIQGCPESGASLLASKDRLYVAWMTGGPDGRARIQLSWSDDGGADFHAPLIASDDIRDSNHAALSQSETNRILLSFQGRLGSPSEAQWSKTSAFVAEIQGDKLSKPQALGNDGLTVSYPASAIGPDGNAFVVWSGASERSNAVVLLRGRIR
ncbi:MAG TPA: sialidase family protein [Candidatus Saccharimonadales bacterium]|nr:sialidase family protein [Candidatus Saccharimonadales bacterium]